jgi:hypothetical protein
MTEVVYDTETFPNFFLCGLQVAGVPGCYFYEVSARRNDAPTLAAILPTFRRMVGFNNLHFDYPLLHHLHAMVASGEAAAIGGEATALRLFNLAQEIIDAGPASRGKYRVWERHQLSPQLDLFLLHHLDNRARMTSLKALQVAMRSPRVQEMPFKVGSVLTSEQMDQTIDYCANDISETDRFRASSADEIAFREELGERYLNMSDAAIGKDIMRRELEARKPGCTQLSTVRSTVPLADVILPYIQFRHQPFREALDRFRNVVVCCDAVRDAFSGASAHHRGLTYDFGVGGLHGSVGPAVVMADSDREILDVDVVSYYPTFAFTNGLYPLHLGAVFCECSRELFARRQRHAKGTPQNKALKLANNAVFGDSGNPYSRGFYDPAFMLATTINGQLLLCMLAEALTEIPCLEVLQANTDGLTVRFPRAERQRVDATLAWWEAGTGLKLESTSYRRLWIRDVNNYLAEREDGKVKRKGAYEYDFSWWQDPSMPAVARATEAALVRGEDVETFLRRRLAEDPWDFLIRARVRGRDRLEWGGRPAQKTTRYYVSRGWRGAPLVKIMPPLAGKTTERRTVLQEGRPVVLCDVFDGQPPDDVDLTWYARQAQKLLLTKLW